MGDSENEAEGGSCYEDREKYEGNDESAIYVTRHGDNRHHHQQPYHHHHRQQQQHHQQSCQQYQHEGQQRRDQQCHQLYQNHQQYQYHEREQYRQRQYERVLDHGREHNDSDNDQHGSQRDKDERDRNDHRGEDQHNQHDRSDSQRDQKQGNRQDRQDDHQAKQANELDQQAGREPEPKEGEEQNANENEGEDNQLSSSVAYLNEGERISLMSHGSTRRSASRCMYRRAEEEETEAAISVGLPASAKAGLYRRCKAYLAEYFADMFGSEFDFNAAYKRAKGYSDGCYQSSITTRTDQQDQVAAWEYLQFFPLCFKETKFENQYSLICGQLFLGRLFLVLLAIILLVIPTMWILGSICFIDVGLNEQSYPAWIAFHISFTVNLVIAFISIALTAHPKKSNCLRKYFEFFAYANVVAWLCTILLVLATFPSLVKAPSQMEMLWEAGQETLTEAMSMGHPLCSLLRSSNALAILLSCVVEGRDAATCMHLCQADQQCQIDAFLLANSGMKFCQDMASAIADDYESLGTSFQHIWFPFAFYLPYVKSTLQIFKIPIVALAIIICVFGTGLMFLDAMSPSRTKMTMALHLILIPICSLPFILLHRTYPSIVPVEETVIFVFAFLFVALAGWCGRYAQEFQHRLIFCSWKLTTTRLQEVSKKMENQKESKKSSAAIEDLIFQVKECNNIVRLARLKGPRADVTDDLFQIEQLLDKILEMLTASGNLYSVRFTDAAKENDVQRQFIELYNTTDKVRKSSATFNRSEVMTTSGSRCVTRQTTAAGQMQELQRNTETSAFGSGTSSSGPVTGLEFNSSSLKHSYLSGNVEEMYALWKKVPMPEATHQLLSFIGIDWDYDILAFSQTTDNVLLEVGYALLCRLVGDWGCDDSQLIRFLATIQGQYLPNPYHNKLHGATVAHLTECLTRMLNVQRTMNSIDKVTLTVAAICHDVGHPGRNNQFFVNCYDPLAVIYNDQAVLENFHSCLTFRTLEMRECNIFANLDDSEFRFLRQNLIACILATDMKQHFESISRFRVRRNSPEFSYSKKQEDRLVARMCMKVADIGHSSVPWAQHFQWSCRVVEEFYQQGGEELARGLPVSPLCDPEKHSDMAKSQNGFLEFVVKPLIKEIEEIEPFSHVENMVSKHLAYNISKWQMLQDAGEPILLNTADNQGKTTVTAEAVRKIAGIKRGPAPNRAMALRSQMTNILKMPTQLRSDLEQTSPQVIQEHRGTPASTPAPLTPDADPTKSFERDASGEQSRTLVPNPLEQVGTDKSYTDSGRENSPTLELDSPSGHRRRVRIASLSFLESSSRPPQGSKDQQ